MEPLPEGKTQVRKKNNIQVRVGGAAGQGGASTGETIAKTFSRHGLNVCTYTSYQSAIRGGHNWIVVRASDSEMQSQGDGLDILIALNHETVEIHSSQINEAGGLIFDSNSIREIDSMIRPDIKKYGLPINELAAKSVNVIGEKYGKELAQKFGKLPVQNTIMMGALVKLLGLKFDVLAGVIETIFGRKKAQVVEFNIDAAKKGYDYSEQNFQVYGSGMTFTSQPKILITGNQALALGAVAAGCKFYAAYPMSPASSILHWLAAHARKYGLVVKQAEDELAVVNMTIGASHVGARAMCATSGGGFSLMTESISMAGMTETPLVVVNCQRTGPSTGLPTKTEQADLHLVMGAGQGDYPKIVLAPRTAEECFLTAGEAFNLADKYQCPVIIVLDLYLSEHYETVESLDLNVNVDRGLMVDGNGDGQDYKRYAMTDSGISPRAIPGQPGHVFQAASDEHDESGNLVSDVLAGIPKYVEVRARMMEKRMKKMESAKDEMQPPKIWGADQAAITIVGWGSTWGQIKDAITLLAEDGVTANSIQFKYIWPFRDKESEELLRSCKNLLLVEGNYTGQFGKLIRQETGIKIENKLLKYDGEPIYPMEIAKKAKEVI